MTHSRYQQPSSRTGRIVMVTLFVCLYGFGFLMLARGLMINRQSLAARHWPTTTGTITHCSMTEETGSDKGNIKKLHVRYNYKVDDVAYDSDRVAFGFRNDTDVDLLYDALKDAKTATVRYNPKEHATATLTYGLLRSNLMFIISAGLWFWGILGFNMYLLLAKYMNNAALLKNLIVNTHQ